ncbi:MAG: DedA family protein [Peptococcaceae bacterium]|nr:DedA family protein [Peptococcaceae bacterium]
MVITGGAAYSFLGELGLWGVFLGTVIEALGVPFPGGAMLVLAGVLINDGRLSYEITLFLAVTGFNMGATAAYFIGRTVGEPLFGKFERVFKVNHDKLEKARSWMKRSASAFIIFGRFVPMASNLTPYLAGMSRLGPGRFLLYNSIFALVWASFNIGLGYYFSRSWQKVMKLTSAHLPYIAAVVLLVYAAALVFMKRKL